MKHLHPTTRFPVIADVDWGESIASLLFLVLILVEDWKSSPQEG